MSDPKSPEPGLEADDRFPSGEWTGFFLQPVLAGKHWMELHLTFRDGLIRGEGRDRVGEFHLKGRYQVEDGKCWWTKSYVGKHSVAYKGYNEGRGIWGTWEMYDPWRGGFRIWPIAMGDPTLERLDAEADVPASEVVVAELQPEALPETVAEPMAVPAGATRPAPALGLTSRLSAHPDRSDSAPPTAMR